MIVITSFTTHLEKRAWVITKYTKITNADINRLYSLWQDLLEGDDTQGLHLFVSKNFSPHSPQTFWIFLQFLHWLLNVYLNLQKSMVYQPGQSPSRPASFHNTLWLYYIPTYGQVLMRFALKSRYQAIRKTHLHGNLRLKISSKNNPKGEMIPLIKLQMYHYNYYEPLEMT